MPAEKTLGIVLRTQDYRDTSLLAVFYTPDFGKVKAIIKAAKDNRARFGSTLEPFSLNEITVYFRPRGDLHLVTSADLVENYHAIRRDLNCLGWASYFLELVDEFTESGPSHPRIFDLLKEALAVLRPGSDGSLLARLFELKLVQDLGLMPHLERCVRCGELPEEEVNFSTVSGGILCSRCRKGEGPVVPVPRTAIDFLLKAQDESMSASVRAVLNPFVREKIDRMMRQFIEYHLRAKPKALVFLEKISSGDTMDDKPVRPLAGFGTASL